MTAVTAYLHALSPGQLGSLALGLVDLVDILEILHGKFLIVSKSSVGYDEASLEPDSPVLSQIVNMVLSLSSLRGASWAS